MSRATIIAKAVIARQLARQSGRFAGRCEPGESRTAVIASGRWMRHYQFGLLMQLETPDPPTRVIEPRSRLDEPAPPKSAKLTKAVSAPRFS